MMILLTLFAIKLASSEPLTFADIENFGKASGGAGCKAGYVEASWKDMGPQVGTLSEGTFCHLKGNTYKTEKYDEASGWVTQNEQCGNYTLMPFKICLDECSRQKTVNFLKIQYTNSEGSLVNVDYYSLGKNCYFTCPENKTTVESGSCKTRLEISLADSTEEEPDVNILNYTTQSTSIFFSKNYDQAILYATSVMKPDQIFKLSSDQYTFLFYKMNLTDEEQKEKLKTLGAPEVKYNQIDCIKTNNGIGEGEDIFMALLVINNRTTSISNETRHIIVDWSGKVLDASCASVTVEKKYDKGSDLIDFTIVEDLRSQDIDIFDLDEKAFTDPCLPLEVNGKDTNVEIRKKKLVSSIRVCAKGCTRVGEVDRDHDKVQCTCTGAAQEGFDQKIEAGTEAEEDDDKKYTTNVFKCSSAAFNGSYIGSNYGFIICVVFFVLDIVMFILYCVMFHEPMTKHMIDEFKQYFPNVLAPPRKESKQGLQSSSRELEPSEEGKAPGKLAMKDADVAGEALANEKIGEKVEEGMIEDEVDADSKEDSSAGLENIPENLNNTDFDNALEKDKRPFGNVFGNMLIEKVDLLSVCFLRNIFNPIPLRLMVILFCFIFYFFICAQFLDDDAIVDIYEDSGSAIGSLSSNFGASAATGAIMILVSKFFALLLGVGTTYNYFMRTRLERKEEREKKIKRKEMIKKTKELRNEIKNLYKSRGDVKDEADMLSKQSNYLSELDNNNLEMDSDDEDDEDVDTAEGNRQRGFEDAYRLRELVKGVKVKVGVAFAIIIILSIVFIYYLMAFGNLYKNLQILLIVLVVLGVVMQILYYVILCLLIALFRHLGIKCQNKLLYKLGVFLYVIS